jgi:histidine ammonia-lyase
VPAEPAIVVSSAPMRIAELLAVAGGRRLELDAEAIASIKDSRAVVEAALASGRTVYGLNTGLGHMKDTRLPDARIRALQESMVVGHAAAIGPPLSMMVVRAAMAARVNGIARGGAGASLAAVETLVAMLNAGVHPVVPSAGSVGASDLAQMAAIALVAIGRGEAEVGGEMMSGGEALRRAGIPVLRLEPKDGLALISANGISVGHGALVVFRAMEALEVADLSAVLSLEALSGNVSPFEKSVAAAKGVKGQVNVSAHIRALIRGSDINRDNPSKTVQDPLSFRVVPQVHGAVMEFIELAKRSVETELNAMTDNPLVERGERRMISNGNFHPMLLALAFDALGPALAHTGQLSDRRLSHLWAATFAMPPVSPSDANRSVWGSRAGERGAPLRYAAAAASAELRQLAGPASLDVSPLDLGVEDHATGAPLSVRRTELALERLEDVFAVELLMARDLLTAGQQTRVLGAGSAATLEGVNSVLAKLGPASSAGEFHSAVRGAMRTHLLEAAGKAAGRLSWSG